MCVCAFGNVAESESQIGSEHLSPSGTQTNVRNERNNFSKLNIADDFSLERFLQMSSRHLNKGALRMVPRFQDLFRVQMEDPPAKMRWSTLLPGLIEVRSQYSRFRYTVSNTRNKQKRTRPDFSIFIEHQDTKRPCDSYVERKANELRKYRSTCRQCEKMLKADALKLFGCRKVGGRILSSFSISHTFCCSNAVQLAWFDMLGIGKSGTPMKKPDDVPTSKGLFVFLQ